MQKLKILYISHTPEIAGAENCLLILLKYVDRSLFEPVVVFPYPGPLVKRIEHMGIRTYIRQLEWCVEPEDGITRQSEDLTTRVQRLVEIIESENPAIIHTNTSVVWEGAIAAKIKGIPHVWHIHEILNGHPSLKSILPLSIFYQLMGLLSARVVVVSEAVKQELSPYITREKLLTIYNGIDVEKIRNAPLLSVRKELSLPAGSLVAITVASLSKYKGHDVLLQAASLVRERGGKVQFVVVGPGSPEAANELRAKIEQLHLQSVVHYLGYRDDVPSIMRDVDFMVLPSFKEAFPLVVLESMALGKPVIATDCSGPAEMINDGESGIIVQVNNPQQLADGICRVALDSEKRRSMGEKARERFLTCFGTDVYANNFEGLYLTLAKESLPVAAMQEEMSLLQAFMAVYQSFMARRDVEVSVQERQLAAKERELRELRSSMSWRVTSPLRWLHRLLTCGS